MQQQYHEILDVKYWKTEQRVWRRGKTEHDKELFKTIALLGLGFFFWGLASYASGVGRTALDLIGGTFALLSFIFVKTRAKLHR